MGNKGKKIPAPLAGSRSKDSKWWSSSLVLLRLYKLREYDHL
jgi:hypothetical protein